MTAPFFRMPRGSMGEEVHEPGFWQHECDTAGPTGTACGQECSWCGARQAATVTIEPDVPQHQRAQRARDAEQAVMLGRPRLTELGAEPWDRSEGGAS